MKYFAIALPKEPTKLPSHLAVPVLNSGSSSRILLPELNTMLFPASNVIFLPEIFTSPFGAEISIPVNAEIFTEPKGLLIEMDRLAVDIDTS